jgi:pimeloyl-ACP methyl ester carboxylesterase
MVAILQPPYLQSRRLASLPRVIRSVVVIATLLTSLGAVAAATAVEIRVHLDPAAAKKPLTGRLFVFFTTSKRGEPRMGPNWFEPEPFLAQDVENFAPGEKLKLDRLADGYPTPAGPKPGKYRVQAVLHLDRDCPFPGSGVGNPYSEVQDVELKDEATAVELTLTKTVVEPAFPKTAWRKEIALKSKLLSEFHKRDVVERCAVVLPDGYADEPERRYPVIYSIPGFGGSHRDGLRVAGPTDAEAEVKFIRVYLSGRCEWGHHVFADSATNGPRGAALIKETIPHIDKTFRTIAKPTARFVTGHSSGGWSSLWLQVTYPEVFGGVWSLAPDPVDFRDFQQVDLYAAPAFNMFRDPSDKRRPLARRGETPVLWFDDFTRMDHVILRGGQLRSFDAVFSPLDQAGRPRRMYDPTSGQVDPKVAEAWRPYDINLKLKQNWKTLEPLLRGKLHIVTGDLDTFYLNGAVELLAVTLKELKSDAQLEILAGEDHGSFVTSAFRKKVLQEMTDQFLAAHPQPKHPKNAAETAPAQASPPKPK